ncbi:glycosyltransferase [Streptacidiphilus monticola]|uniref:Glycosyltransferase n=1 Tax=Streptacidiphilus monticola TaxID=2161674 RepID=A0ABW1G2X9_9ACTN
MAANRPTRPTRPLSLALVSEHASPLAVLGGVDAGGQNVHVAALAGALADRGHQVVVHTRRDDPLLPVDVPLRPGVVVRHVDAGPPEPLPKDRLLPYMAEFGARLAADWEAAPPDAVHSHFWMSGLAALLGAHRVGGHRIPVVHTYHALGTVKRRHQGAADTSPPRRVEIETAVGRAVDRIVATCRDEVAELRAMGVDDTHVRIVPCGVDPDRFRPDGPREARGPGHRILAVGRLVPRKGTDVAIRALAVLPDTELLVVGGPPAEELAGDEEARRLRAVAEQAGVADRVRLLGGVPSSRMPQLLRSADLVVCPAQYEPFGIVPLEAMACGVPVVATAVGGHLDSVAEGVTGRLVPQGDTERFAAEVAALLRQPGLRRAYGAAGRRRVLDRFGWNQVAAATEAVYAELQPSAAEFGPSVAPAGARYADAGPAAAAPVPTTVEEAA